MSSLKYFMRHVMTARLSGNVKQSSRLDVFQSRSASLPSQSNQNLDGRVALVTAGTCGIGLSIARRLAEHGAKVIVSSRNQENIDSAVKELRDEGLQVSLTTLWKHFWLNKVGRVVTIPSPQNYHAVIFPVRRGLLLYAQSARSLLSQLENWQTSRQSTLCANRSFSGELTRIGNYNRLVYFIRKFGGWIRDHARTAKLVSAAFRVRSQASWHLDTKGCVCMGVIATRVGPRSHRAQLPCVLSMYTTIYDTCWN